MCTRRGWQGLMGLTMCWVWATAATAQEGDFVPLFNGKDLTGFYTFLVGYGKNHDPEQVFRVEDGVIHVSGKVWGGFITEQEYENYHLVFEYKWGEKTWPPRADRARDSGVLLHCVGPEGAYGGVWMESIECQIIEGGSGDILLVCPPNRTMKLTARVNDQGNYDPQGEPREYTKGRINWSGRDRNWKDVLGFRGEKDVEKPLGEWNRMECLCEGDKLTYILNGQIVNAGYGASHTKGKLLFQSEGAEIFFRNIALKPLKPQATSQPQ